jgi:adenylate cyclase
MLAGLVAARRRAAALRLRFERHLAPGVVARLAADPALLRLPVERRSVTAVFTDLEGFTAAAVRLPPERLVAILDAYFGGLTAIVHAHGGMVDKFVGDAAHCLFNAPFDLPGHAARALDCALALRAWGESFAADPAHAGLGRTRVGVETGPVVVGEVGSGTKLDYTAHGTAVNLAARLEQAAGPLGCGILAGPGARAADPDRAWQARGTLELKGLGPVEVHEPGPARPPGSATVRDGAA